MKTRGELDMSLDSLCRQLPALLKAVDQLGHRRVYECFADELRTVCAPADREHLERRLQHVWMHCRGAEPAASTRGAARVSPDWHAPH